MGILKRRAVIFSLMLVGLLLGAVPVLAAPAPPVAVHDARVMRNAFEEGDLLVFFEAELPRSNWAAYPNDALVRLTTLSAATVYQERPNPTIGVFLTGFYLPVDHGIPWESTDLTASIISNPTSFDTLESASYNMTSSNYVTTVGLIYGSDSNGEIVCNQLTAMLQDIELLDPDIAAEALVDGYGRITDAGLSMSRNVISPIAQLLATCFPVGTTLSSEGFNPTGTGAQATGLQTSLELTPTWSRWAAFSTSIGFTNAGVLAALVAVIAAVAVVVITAGMSGSIQFGMAAGAVMLFGGALLTPGVMLQGAMLTIAFLFILLGAFVFQRLPR